MTQRRTALWPMLLAAMVVAAGATARAQPAVTWLILVDDLHLDFRNTGRIRAMVRTVLKTLPADGELAAMRSCGPSGVSVSPTLDRALLDSEMRKLTGNGLRPDDIQIGLASGEREVRYRAAGAQECVRELIATAGSAPAGASQDPPLRRRTALIYISNGYGSGEPPDLGAGPSPMVFALDPRLLVGFDLDRKTWPEHWAATRNSLRALTEASGGFLQSEDQSLDDALARIIQVIRK